MANCMKCGKTLTGDEIGLHKKMIHRGAKTFMCFTCMANYFQCEPQILIEKVRQFKKVGCTLFPPEQ